MCWLIMIASTQTANTKGNNQYSTCDSYAFKKTHGVPLLPIEKVTVTAANKIATVTVVTIKTANVAYDD